MVSHCGFNLHFLNDKWNWSLLLYLSLLAFWISSFMKCLFKSFLHFSISFFLIYWFVEVVYSRYEPSVSHTHTKINICTITSIVRSWLKKRTWKELLQILAQAGGFWKRIGHWKLRVLKLTPCKPSLPIQPLVSLHVQRGVHITVWRMLVWNIFCFYFSSFIET